MIRRIVTALTCYTLAIGMASATRGQFTLDANYDHASLSSYTVNGNTINLVGRSNYYGNSKWRWMYFQATGVLGAQPTFTINQNFAGDTTPGPHELQEHEMVYSYDNQNWSFFDNNQLVTTTPTALYQFSNSTPFAQDQVYVAYAIPYSYGKSAAHTATVIASPWAAPTVSGDSNGVIGQSKANVVDDLGRPTPALNLFGYRITNPATDSPTAAKRKLMISTGLHAGEPLGTHTFEGLVNWLISDDPRAARLRNIAEVFAYPVLNPTGRYRGMNRTTVGNPGVDPNGLWDSTRWSSSSYGCGSNNCQDVRETGTAMIADVASTPGYLDAFIDFHSTVPDYANPTGLPNDFGYVNSADSNTDWWLTLQQLAAPNVLEYTSGNGDYTTTGFARRILDTRPANVSPRVVEVTLETQFTWERNVDYYHHLGELFGIAFYTAWVPQVAGDFTGDGIVDARDYTLWRGTAGQSGPALQADGNHDTFVDDDDYTIWRSHYGQSAGSDSAELAPVPEPNVLFIAFGIAAICFLQRNSIKRDEA